MLSLFRKTMTAEPEPETVVSEEEAVLTQFPEELRKVHLRELEGGERVLQLWENLKEERKKERHFDPQAFSAKMATFLFHAIEALVDGHPPKPVIVEPEQPDYMKGIVRNGSDDHKRRQLHQQGWTFEDIEATSPEYYQIAISQSWNFKRTAEYAAEIKALRDAEYAKKKARWPDRYE